MKKVELDLFKLHDYEKDKRPLMWICASGNNLNREVNSLVSTVLKKYKINKWKLSKILLSRICCGKSSITQTLYNNRKFIPFVIIEQLILLLFNNNKKINKAKNKIQKSFEILKCNNSSSTHIFAVKELTFDFCKFIGAYIADGTMSEKSESSLFTFLSILRKSKMVLLASVKRSRRLYRYKFNQNVKEWELSYRPWLSDLYAI